MFEFDAAKSASNKLKHGLDFVEAQALWMNETIEVSAKPGRGEIRYAALGEINRQPFTAIITYRGASIRIISVRPSSTAETAIYAARKKAQS